MPALVDRILDALPQTQCTRCGFQDCRAYAEAIASKAEPINQCPPGGQEGVDRLARLTQQASLPLNRAFGHEAPRGVARIDEAWCIGCTLCIKACPTDAILGANKFMHTVIEAYCTGCALCLPPCPVDCIEMLPVSGTTSGWAAWSAQQAEQARKRYEAHTRRRARIAPASAPTGDTNQADAGLTPTPEVSIAEADQATRKKMAAQAALARARARRTPNQPAD